MRIEFESRNEIKRIAALLQDIYPAALCITTDDLIDAKAGNLDRELPWNLDGFHPCIDISDEKPIGKRKEDERLYTYTEVFPRGTVWEEVQQDGKKYLRRVISGPFQSEDALLYLAGQLDGFFQLVHAGSHTYKDVANLTGMTEQHLVDLCRIWSRRVMGK